MAASDDERTELDDMVAIERSRFDELAARASRASQTLADCELEVNERQLAEKRVRASCGALLRVAGESCRRSVQLDSLRGVYSRIEAAARARLDAASAVRSADAARVSAQAHLDQVRREVSRVEERVRTLERAIAERRRERILRRADDAEHEAIEEESRRLGEEETP